MTRQAKYKKRQDRERSISKSAASKSASRPAQSGLQEEILNLQRSAGNKVVSQLLQDEAGEKHHTSVDSSVVDSTLDSEGQPLDATARSQMEGLFNEDFSGVRIHTDAEAAESAQAVEARAYTSGEDVVFGANQYRPDTGEGKDLIAHELAHTVQHRDAGHAASPGAGTSISRQPLGAKDPISLFPDIPAPVVSRMGNMLVATVYFGQKFFLLDPRNFAAVEQVGEDLKFVLNPSIAVNGYTSSEGSKAYNQKLSENRRDTVITVLKSKISGPSTFTGKGHGASALDVPETGKKGKDLESQQAQNRRVTIVATLPAAAPAKPAGGATSTPSKELPKDEWSPIEPEGPKPFPFPPKIPYRPETPRELGERMMREAAEAEKIRKERAAQKGGQSLNDWFYKKVDDGVEKVAEKFRIPEKLRPYLKKAVRAGIEKGVEAAVDEILDQTPLSDNEKEAAKKALEALSETEPPVNPR
jgi:outer membrane protein OmpA-like peptidoglycan-associated protein